MTICTPLRQCLDPVSLSAIASMTARGMDETRAYILSEKVLYMIFRLEGFLKNFSNW